MPEGLLAAWIAQKYKLNMELCSLCWNLFQIAVDDKYFLIFENKKPFNLKSLYGVEFQRLTKVRTLADERPDFSALKTGLYEERNRFLAKEKQIPRKNRSNLASPRHCMLTFFVCECSDAICRSREKHVILFFHGEEKNADSGIIIKQETT